MSVVPLLLLLLHATAVWSQSYMNPVDNCNCADPGVVYDASASVYYVATTSGNDANHFPIRRSNNLVDWSQVGYVFPSGTQPKWAVSNFWAPEIHYVKANTYNVYFVATDASTHLLSVGVGTASTAHGPFTDPIGKPLVSGDVQTGIGNIDPNFFRDPLTGTPYLLYKYDGNSKNQATPIYMEQLSDDGTAVVAGTRTQLITSGERWECANHYCVTEAPWMIYNAHTQYYYLFYSGNAYNGDAYNVAVARSSQKKNIHSKFVKFDGPILHTRWGAPFITDVNAYTQWAGPGHPSVVQYGADADWVMVYHCWNSTHVGNGNRYLMADQLLWVRDWPRIFTDSPSDVTKELLTNYGHSSAAHAHAHAHARTNNTMA